MTSNLKTRVAIKAMHESNERFMKHAQLPIRRAKQKKGPIDFRFKGDLYRAWSNGAVTILDSDGDSVATAIEAPPTAIEFVISAPLLNALASRVASGLYGRTIEEVAERLLCEALRS